MRKDREYSDIPGTYVFDPDHSMQGYELNMFCMSLNNPDNRDKFRQDEAAYLDGFPLTSEQRQAVLTRDWIGLLRLGAIFTTLLSWLFLTAEVCNMSVVQCQG